MRIYVAGPMSGIEDHNLPAFAAAARQLDEAGHIAVNPGRRGVIPSATWSDYLRMALVDMLGCDAVALLPGWEQSRGATLEVHVAEALDMPVNPLDEWLSDLRPRTEQLLGIAPQWLGGKSVGEYLEEIRED
jgi:hypothetical protein